MAAYDLEEQEQLAELKAWWRQNGSFVLGVIALVLLVYSGWNGWRWYQRSQALEAAALYENLQVAARQNDSKAVRDSAGSILEKYTRTAYAPLAAMVSAKSSYQAGDLKSARAQLQWVVEHADLEELRAIARLRLATVLMDEKAYDEAMKALETKPGEVFEPLFASMRGDVLSAQGKRAEARTAYKAALDKAKDGTLREVLDVKLKALGR